MKDELDNLIDQLEKLLNLEMKDHVEIGDIFDKFTFNIYSAMHLISKEIRELKKITCVTHVVKDGYLVPMEKENEG